MRSNADDIVGGKIFLSPTTHSQIASGAQIPHECSTSWKSLCDAAEQHHRGNCDIHVTQTHKAVAHMLRSCIFNPRPGFSAARYSKRFNGTLIGA